MESCESDNEFKDLEQLHTGQPQDPAPSKIKKLLARNFKELNSSSKFKERLLVMRYLHDFHLLGQDLENPSIILDTCKSIKESKAELTSILKSVYFPPIQSEEFRKKDDNSDLVVKHIQQSFHN